MGFGDLLSMFGGSGGMGSMPVNFGQMSLPAAPDMQSANFSAMPQMANPSQSPFAMIGNALMGAHRGQQQDTSSMQPAQVQSAAGSNLLQQLLASIGRR